MRRERFVLVGLFCAIPVVAQSQLFPREPSPARAWLVVSDGVGFNGGGISNANGLVQLFRASATVAVTPSIGVEASALRVQVLHPANRLFNDPTLNSPKADGLTLAFASLAGDGNRTKFPASTVIGGALLRRPTNDPTRTRLTGGLMAGIEGSIWTPSADWFDATMGGRLILMPSSNHHQLYMVALTFGLRFG